MKILNEEKIEDIFSVLFLLLTLIFIISIIWINYHGEFFWNFDMYSDAQIAKEIWDNKTLFPDNWVFGNQYYVAATPVLASFFYGIFNDTFTAMATASSTMMILVLLSFVYCMKNVIIKNSIFAGMFCLIGGTIIGCSASSYVNGWQIFYTMASYYSCYLIGILLTMGTYLRIKAGEKCNIFIIVGVILLNLALGMNSPRQMLVQCIPLCIIQGVYLLIEILKNKNVLKTLRKSVKEILFVASIFLVNLIGIGVMEKLDIVSNHIIKETEFIFSIPEIIENIKESIIEFINITGIMIFQEGKNYLLLSIFALLFIIMVISVLVSIIKKKEINKLTTLIWFSVVSILCVFSTGVFIIELRAIYYFVWYLLVTCCVMYLTENLKGDFKFMFLSTITLIGIINGIYNIYPDIVISRKYKESYSTIIEELKAEGIEYIYMDENVPIRILSYSRDEFSLGLLFLDYKEETGYPTYPVPYLQSSENFSNRNSDNAVCITTDNQWKAIEIIFSKEFKNKLESKLECIKVFEPNDGNIYYIYRMKEPIIAEFKYEWIELRK